MEKELGPTGGPLTREKKGKRWSYEEDDFLFNYWDGVGSYIGPHDLGRSKVACANRVALLKRRGGWDALMRLNKARYEYEYAMHPEAHGYMDPPEGDEE
jgi:hypothetical protein